MKDTAFLFPGQGSQIVGMGKDLFENSELGRKTFKLADEVLGYALSRICFEGPEAELTLTPNTQPALLTVSYILFSLFGKEPAVAAGHSLGEYSALLCSGALDFADAVLLVHKRGKYMQEAVPVGRGAMAALIGIDMEKVKLGLAQVGGVVDVANWNSASQIVISGEKQAVEDAVRIIAAPKSVFLPVSAPFHSRLMMPAEEKLALDLERTEFKALTFPIVNNVEMKEVRSAFEARQGLKSQVSRPVLWYGTMEKLLKERGMVRFIEIGAGRVLSGLLRRISRELNREVEVSNIETAFDLKKIK